GLRPRARAAARQAGGRLQRQGHERRGARRRHDRRPRRKERSMSVLTDSPAATADTPAAAPRKRSLGQWVRDGVRAQAMQIVLVWLGIIIVFSVLSPEAFLDAVNFRNIAISVSILAVLGVGTTFIIITGGIDLSMGSVLVFSGVVASMVMERMGDGQGWGVALAGIAVALTSGLLWGL